MFQCILRDAIPKISWRCCPLRHSEKELLSRQVLKDITNVIVHHTIIQIPTGCIVVQHEAHDASFLTFSRRGVFVRVAGMEDRQVIDEEQITFLLCEFDA